MSNWNDFVKKVFQEGKAKNSNYSLKDALKEASKRKSEMKGGSTPASSATVTPASSATVTPASSSTFTPASSSTFTPASSSTPPVKMSGGGEDLKKRCAELKKRIDELEHDIQKMLGGSKKSRVTRKNRRHKK
jgi:hypothetical protein